MLREAPVVPLVNDLIDAIATLAGSYLGLRAGGLPGAVAGCAVGGCTELDCNDGLGLVALSVRAVHQ